MTDKYLLNVSECKFYRDEVSFIGGETLTDVCSIWIWQRDYSGLEPSCTMKCHCSDNPNCFIKQFFEERYKGDNQIVELNKMIKTKEQELNDYKKQFKADTKEMENYQNEITRHLESAEYWQHQAEVKDQECKRLKWYMQEIRMQELSHLDIEWDEYETHCTNTEYSNIINLVEEALEERSREDCRYDK